MVRRDRPLPAEWPAERGLDAYLTENGFTRAGYDARTTPAKILGIRFRVPNTPRHRWAIMRHDLHHVATGYGTDLRGEAEVSAWELRRGIRGVGLYVGAIIVSIVLAGLVIAPRRTARAWRAAGRGRSLFQRDAPDYDALMQGTVGDLRAALDVPATGVADHPRRLHGDAPRAT